MAAEDWIDFDYYDDKRDGQPSCWDELRESSSTKWMLKDKTIVNIRDMETSHIKNSMAMLERAGQDECKAYKGLVKELEKRNG